MTDFDYDSARKLLDKTFTEAEDLCLNGVIPKQPQNLNDSFDLIFKSATQAFREVLLGCVLVRIQNKSIDLTMPYVNQGTHAFNGRDIDERVVNPFLHDKRIPASRGPFLSVFRRSVRFDTSTRSGVRDKKGFDAFVTLVGVVSQLRSNDELLAFLRYLACKFVELRENSVVPLARIRRISLEQLGGLIDGLLATASGGRFPVILVASMFQTLVNHLTLSWTIDCQGINVADKASGAGGDITIRASDGNVVLAAEVTERTVDRSRVVATFNTKIAPAGIEDYLFFVPTNKQPAEAVQQARQYFTQGHEVNFVQIKEWIQMTLATLGSRGRQLFCQELLAKLGEPGVPKVMKVAWNEQVDRMTET